MCRAGTAAGAKQTILGTNRAVINSEQNVLPSGDVNQSIISSGTMRLLGPASPCN